MRVIVILSALFLSACSTSVAEELVPLVRVIDNPVEQTAMDGSPRVSLPYRAALTGAARRVWGMDAPVPLLAAQIHQESRWRPDARSRVGAQGAAQFMPSTAAWIVQAYPDLGPAAPFNPAWSFAAQSRYVKHLYDRIHYPKDCDRFGAALSSYNGGEGHHNNRRRMAADPNDFWNSVRPIRPPGVSAANNRENEAYSQIIVYQHQPLFRTWGPTSCNV